MAASAGIAGMTGTVALSACGAAGHHTGPTVTASTAKSVTAAHNKHVAPSPGVSAQPALKPPMAHPARSRRHKRHVTSGAS